MERRQFGLVQQSSQSFSLEDRRWLQTQGIDRPETLPRKSLWYKPDGTSSLGPSDPYHLGLYRRRGMTLAPPVVTAQEPVHRGATPVLVNKVLRVLGEDQRWEGTATELADRCGMSAVGISRALGAPKVTAALSAAGVIGSRGYRGKRKRLLLERRSDA